MDQNLKSEILRDLASEITALKNLVVQQKAEIDQLKKVVESSPQLQQTKARTSSTRRQMLRKLFLGISGSLGLGVVAFSIPGGTAEGRTLVGNNPGITVVRNGVTVSGTPQASAYYGLVASADASLNLSNLITYGPGDTNVGVYGRSTFTQTSAIAVGVWGEVQGGGLSAGVIGWNGSNGFGVFGTNPGNGTGVRAYSETGYGLYALSNSGSPLVIQPGVQPANTATIQGSIYVDGSGDLHIFNGTEWRKVTTTAG